jgi:hypothetical protein
MASPTPSVIHALRCTAVELNRRSDYQWGHMGSCNCGFLAQQVSHLRKNEIHTYAMQRYGDWNEQLNDYCPTSGYAMDDLITRLIDFGFDIDDLKHLEWLSDRNVLRMIPNGAQHLKCNVKTDVVRYLNAWANVLEATLLEKITLPIHESVQMEV